MSDEGRSILEELGARLLLDRLDDAMGAGAERSPKRRIAEPSPRGTG